MRQLLVRVLDTIVRTRFVLAAVVLPASQERRWEGGGVTRASAVCRPHILKEFA